MSESVLNESRPAFASVEQAFARVSGAPLVTGNEVGLLKDADQNYPAWLEAIGAARRTIHFESYIIHDDATGQEFARALAAQARAGVRVRLIYDWLGAVGKTSRRFWRDLRAAGVEVRCFNPPSLSSAITWLSRDHRKMLAVPVIPRQPIAQPIRHRQDPLAHRHPRQHRVHQMGSALGHPPAPAARAEAAALAGERHEVLAGATLASKARHTALEHAARQELSELALDELRQTGSVAGLRHRAQEGLQVLGDDLMEHGVLGVAGPVDRSLEGHGPQVRSGREQGGDDGGRTGAGGESTFRNGGEGDLALVDHVV